MTSFSTPYLPLDSPSYFDSPVFWVSVAVAAVLTIGLPILLRWLDLRSHAAKEASPGATKKPHCPTGLFVFMSAGLAMISYIVVLMVMSGIPAYADTYSKVNENIKAKYLIEDADVEVPEGVSNFVVDPATGDTLTRVDATVVRDGKVLVVPYHVSIDRETGEPTLQSVVDSPAFSIAPEKLLIK